MAKAITRRTLAGYKDMVVNVHYFDDLVSMLKNKPESFSKKVLKPSYWGQNGGGEMKFDAVVGNPPYQLTEGSGGSNDAPIYQYFVESAHKITTRYASLIIPSRWFTTGREFLLGDFRTRMLNDPGLRALYAFTDSRDVFPSVEIKGGLCYYLYDTNYSGECHYTLVQEGQRISTKRRLDDFDILIREPILADIVKKIMEKSGHDGKTVSSIISSDTPFGIPTNPQSSKNNPITVFSSKGVDHNTKLFHIENAKRKIAYIDGTSVKKNINMIGAIKVFIPEGYGAGESFPHQILGVPEYAGRNSVCSQSYLYAPFDTESEAMNFISYLKTKFFRALVLAAKISQHAPSRTYRFVPLLDMNRSWSDIELYAMYGLSSEEISFIESTIRPMR